ncbi:MAG: IPTL-CTERM sorting domain-containing protein [Planctomycetes bacterium]|nr:IPTL-CTERM sorting domain-containing protein [Planctomycetota bacterium]
MRLLPAMRIVVLVCAAFAWTGQSDAATVEVSTSGLTFVPADVSIAFGDSVHFTGLAAGIHTVAEVDDETATSWNSGFHSPSSASEFTQVFNSAGVFYYICEPHVFAVPSMRGTVTVTGGQVPTISQWGVVVMALLMLTAGTIVLVRRGRVEPSLGG